MIFQAFSNVCGAIYDGETQGFGTLGMIASTKGCKEIVGISVLSLCLSKFWRKKRTIIKGVMIFFVKGGLSPLSEGARKRDTKDRKHEGGHAIHNL